MQTVEEMVEKAREAQAEWEKSGQKRIDAVVREIGKTVYDNAEWLARLTVEETQAGNYEDNLRQDKRKASIIWHSLKGRKSLGIVKRDQETGLVEVAKPIGVVAAILPMTIPVTNFMSNAMFSVKARNAVIAAPHPKAAETVAATASLILAALAKFDVPRGLIQYLEEPSIDLTKELMTKADVIVATGGMPMVKSAYSSGKPAYGVGPGNVQCIVDRGVDIEEAVPKIVDGRAFNNGLPCACEQAVMIHRDDIDEALQCFARNKAVFIDDSETIQRLAKALYTDGVLSRDGMGITAPKLAEKIGLSVPQDTRVLLIKADDNTIESLRKEKLSPVTLVYTYSSFEEAVQLIKANISLQGRGHSVAIHSGDQEHIEALAIAIPVTRVIVNQCATTSAGGSFMNGFGATTTLGTGFWGNTVLQGNLDFTHLMNYTRIGYPPAAARVPADEEIWGEDPYLEEITGSSPKGPVSFISSVGSTAT
jgi:succinate-semialdehyde dehydrogenase